MRILRTAQTIWALVLIVFPGMVVASNPNTKGIICGILIAIYFTAVLLSSRNLRVAWVVLFIIPCVAFILWTPPVVYNCYHFFTGHELYIDSPATFIIVMVYAVVFVIPSFILLLLFWIYRREFRAILRGQLKTEKPSEENKDK